MSRSAARRALSCLVALLVLSPSPSPSSSIEAVEVAAAIRSQLAHDGTVAGLGRMAEPLRSFYQSRAFRPAWTDGETGGKRLRAALAVLAGAAEHGLDPDSYFSHQSLGPSPPRTAPERAGLDIRLSAALGRYATDLRNGRVSEESREAWEHLRDLRPAKALLEGATNAADLGRYFSDLAPETPEYRRLQQAYAAYRAIDARGGWPRVPDGAALRRDMQSPAIPLLHQRLVITGDLDPGAVRGEVFDAALEAAVKRFQRRHGLAADGIVGRNTRAALNVPVGQRLAEMRINLERRRWMPEDLGSSYIFVNMVDFVLKVVEGRKTVLDMKVIVGTPFWRTPLFSATMTYMEFNPYWHIPQSIVRREIAPRAIVDPEYLTARGIRVFGDTGTSASELSPDRVDWQAVQRGEVLVRLRQEPGPLNPLGRVKFMFPNAFSVYLHDTPERELFRHDVRTFSHGCIRMEKPFALAAYLLREEAPAPIEELLEGGRPYVVTLKRPIPVHLVYLTAWVNKDGSVHFRRDVYGRDRELAAALARAEAK